MNSDLKFDQPAKLRFRDFEARFDTMRAAIEEWKSLAKQEQDHVILVAEDGRVWQPSEISELGSNR